MVRRMEGKNENVPSKLETQKTMPVFVRTLDHKDKNIAIT